jgi:hypothetical protein
MAKKRTPHDRAPAGSTSPVPAARKLLVELRSLIQATRSGVAQAVNSAQVLLSWEIGQRIRTEVLGGVLAQIITPYLDSPWIASFLNVTTGTLSSEVLDFLVNKGASAFANFKAPVRPSFSKNAVIRDPSGNGVASNHINVTSFYLNSLLTGPTPYILPPFWIELH